MLATLGIYQDAIMQKSVDGVSPQASSQLCTRADPAVDV